MNLNYLRVITSGIILTLILFTSTIVTAQDNDSTEIKQLPFSVFREVENYSYLKNNKELQKGFFNDIKYVPLNKNGSVNLSFGGQIRSRYENYSNRLWQEARDEDFYSQRVAFHINISLGKNIRVFGELYNGLTSGDKEFSQDDDAAVFQVFIDYTSFLSKYKKLIVRLGRQELALGSARLVGIREGPNIRRSFDMGKLLYASKQSTTQFFYGKEVIPLFGSFDNDFSLFDSKTTNAALWGIYSQFKLPKISGTNEFYYLGFKGKNSRFNDVSGEEKRHTIGFRRFGKLGKKFKYNTELMYQFGKISNSDISAYSLATDIYYQINESSWKPEVGLKLEYSSGDKEQGDGKIQSFNPMFVNPAHYSLAGIVTPVNMISFHPSVKVKVNDKIKLYAEWATFWRNSSKDALYMPTRFINLPSNAVESKKIGHQFAFMSSYEINRNLSFDLDISYFIAGDFLEQQNLNNNIFHIAPTISYKF